MGNEKGKNKVTVETLLHLKRNERPAEEFWDTFEKDFHRRRLHALVEQGSSRNFLRHPFYKTLAFALPTLLLVGMTVFWSREDRARNSSPSMVEDPVAFSSQEAVAQVEAKPVSAGRQEAIPDLRDGSVSSQFVVDAIHSSQSPSTNFRKVLYTPAIQLSSPTGASYVRDNLSSRNYQVTTADLKLGRNF